MFHLVPGGVPSGAERKRDPRLMNPLVNLVHHLVKRLWNVVRLRPINLVVATAKAKEIKAVSNDTTTTGRARGEREGWKERVGEGRG